MELVFGGGSGESYESTRITEATPTSQRVNFESNDMSERNRQGLDGHRSRVSQSTNVELLYWRLHVDETRSTFILIRIRQLFRWRIFVKPVDPQRGQTAEPGKVPYNI